jgi:hypothetical protein
MTFFFDVCLSPRIARALDELDRSNQIVHQSSDSRFSCDTPDEDIIKLIASDDPKPVLITSDHAMTRKPVERAALAGSGLTVVFLKKGWASLPFEEQAAKMVKIWWQIAKATSRCREPTAFEIAPRASKVDKLCETADLACK